MTNASVILFVSYILSLIFLIIFFRTFLHAEYQKGKEQKLRTISPKTYAWICAFVLESL